jgi:hypothetical protein
MEGFPGVRRLFRLPAGRRAVQLHVDDELRFHLDMRAEEHAPRAAGSRQADCSIAGTAVCPAWGQQ